jgi:ribosomal protein S18 acetylase RimI-like enzyme
LTLPFSLRDASGADVGVLTLIPHGPIGELRLTWGTVGGPPTRASWRAAFDAVADAADRSALCALEARVRAAPDDARARSYEAALSEAGLVLDHERRELSVPLADALAGRPPPLTLSWRVVPVETPNTPAFRRFGSPRPACGRRPARRKLVGYAQDTSLFAPSTRRPRRRPKTTRTADVRNDLSHVATLMRETSADDPGFDPAEDATAFLRDAAHPTGVLVGADDRGPVALVVPTLSANGEVGTLSWLGIAPRARRRGHGREALSRGLIALQALGATIWRDGTRSDNHAAARLVGDVPWSTIRVWRRTFAATSAADPDRRTARDGGAP